MNLYPIQPSFAAGELSPSMAGRVDIAKYSVGLAKCRNCFVHSYGGVSNRPGTEFIAEVKDSSKKVRLVPFQYSTEQTYILEFGNYYVRFYMDGYRIESGGVPVEVVTPYSEAMLDKLNFAQSADVLFIVHPNVRPKMLSRYSHTSWTFKDFTFSRGPFMDTNTTDMTVTPSAVEGTGITLTASEDFFTAGDVGTLFHVGEDRAAVIVRGVPNVGAYVSGGTYNVNDFVTSGGFIWRCLTDGTTAAPAEGTSWEKCGEPGSTVSMEVVTYSGYDVSTCGFWNGSFALQRLDSNGNWKDVRSYSSSCSNGASSTAGSKNYADSGTVEEATKLRIYSAGFQQVVPNGGNNPDKGFITLTAKGGECWGIVKITSVTSARVAVCDVIERLPSTQPTKVWAEGSWSDVNGWPRTVGFFQQRMAFGGTYVEPQTLWFSKPDAFNDFGTTIPTADDDAISITLAADQVNEIRHVVGLGDFQVFTASSEWSVAPGSEPFTPTNAPAKPQTYYGANMVRPVVVGNIVIYVQNKGSAVRNHGYVLDSDGYKGTSLSLMAGHFFKEHEIVSMALQNEPWGVLWCVRNDGKLLGLTYLPEHDVVAWHLHSTEGEFESAASVSGDEQDDVYFVVKRTVNGSVKRYVEMLSHRLTDDDLKQAVFLDSSLSYHGTAAVTELSGLGHLAGCKVNALADGFVVTDLTVSGDGKVTLPHSASDVCVGLPYTAEVKTLPLEVSGQDGTMQGRRKSIHRLTLRLENSLGGKIGSSESGTLDEIKFRTNENYGEHTRLRTGDASLMFPDGYNRQGQVYVKQDEPLPLSILAIIPEVTGGN